MTFVVVMNSLLWTSVGWKEGNTEGSVGSTAGFTLQLAVHYEPCGSPTLIFHNLRETKRVANVEHRRPQEKWHK